MNVVIGLADFDPDAVFFHAPVKNTIMPNSNFIRVLYSTDYFVLTNILLEVEFVVDGVTRYFERRRHSFDPERNRAVIAKIEAVERTMLERLSLRGKKPVHRVGAQLSGGTAKLYTTLPAGSVHRNARYILKISGVWESGDPHGEYGLNYKFVELLDAPANAVAMPTRPLRST